MAIQRKPKSAAARDAAAVAKPAAYDKGVPKGHKRQISLTIAPEMLRQVDERAKHAGVGRAAFISMAIRKALDEN